MLDGCAEGSERGADEGAVCAGYRGIRVGLGGGEKPGSLGRLDLKLRKGEAAEAAGSGRNSALGASTGNEFGDGEGDANHFSRQRIGRVHKEYLIGECQ